jgi:hypothetical protein
MTLKRVRVSLTPTTAKQVGVGFVTVTRVGHPWQLMFETDLPPYQAFQEAVYGEEFRARQRFKLQLRAMAADTIRRYAQKGVIYEKEQWTRADGLLAQRLLDEVAAVAEEQRAGEFWMRQRDLWPWPDAREPPIEVVLGAAVGRVVHAGAASEDDAIRVSGLLKGERQVFSVHKAMGCLVPRSLDPRLDGVKPRGKARAGATTPGVKVRGEVGD